MRFYSKMRNFMVRFCGKPVRFTGHIADVSDPKIIEAMLKDHSHGVKFQQETPDGKPPELLGGVIPPPPREIISGGNFEMIRRSAAKKPHVLEGLREAKKQREKIVASVKEKAELNPEEQAWAKEAAPKPGVSEEKSAIEELKEKGDIEMDSKGHVWKTKGAAKASATFRSKKDGRIRAVEPDGDGGYYIRAFGVPAK